MSESKPIVDVSAATFESAVLARSHTTPVVVDFWAPWCGPCRMLGPILEKLALQSAGAFVLAKVNADENPALSAEYGVRGIPAVKAFKDGRVVAEFTGALPEPKVREFIRRLAPSATEQALGEGLSLLATRHWAPAEAAFRRALEQQPGYGAAALGLLKALLAQGRGCEAADLLEEFPRSDESTAAEKLRPLAEALCAVEGADLPVDESELDAQHHQAARLAARGHWAAALDGWLDVLRQDKKYRGGAARLICLAIFELLGDDDPLTREYRRELASVLF